MEFKKFEDVEIFDNDQLADSCFNGVDKLLKTNMQKCIFVTSEDDEEVNEKYYFLEANADHIERTDDDVLLCRLDETNFVLLEENNELIIVVDEKDKDTVEAL